jgi:hypothetical protein
MLARQPSGGKLAIRKADWITMRLQCRALIRFTPTPTNVSFDNLIRLSKKELARAAQQRREEEIEGAKKHKEDVKQRIKERKRTQQRLNAKTSRCGPHVLSFSVFFFTCFCTVIFVVQKNVFSHL